MSDPGTTPRTSAGTHLYRACLGAAVSLIAWGGNKYFDHLTTQMDRVEQALASGAGATSTLTSRQNILWEKSAAHDAMLADHEHRLIVLETTTRRDKDHANP